MTHCELSCMVGFVSNSDIREAPNQLGTATPSEIIRFRQSIRLTDPIPVNAVLFSAMSNMMSSSWRSTSHNLASSSRHPAFPTWDPALSVSKTGLCLPGDCAGEASDDATRTMMTTEHIISGASYVDLSSLCYNVGWARHTRAATLTSVVPWLLNCFT